MELCDIITEEVLSHAKEEYPKECCGLIVDVGGNNKYIRCTNIAKDKEDEFTISAEEYAGVEDMGDIVAVVHSHPDATTQPSIRDMAVCGEMEIPWVIVSYPDVDINIIYPKEAPLIGRPFSHGTDWDCYGLIRDYYKRNYNISLNRYDHNTIWWEDGKNFYLDNYEREGFFKVTDGTLDVGDLIIMNIMSPIANHGAVYIGDGEILHHLYNRLSRKDVYGGYWAENTVCILRHKDVKR